MPPPWHGTHCCCTFPTKGDRRPHVLISRRRVSSLCKQTFSQSITTVHVRFAGLKSDIIAANRAASISLSSTFRSKMPLLELGYRAWTQWPASMSATVAGSFFRVLLLLSQFGLASGAGGGQPAWRNCQEPFPH